MRSLPLALAAASLALLSGCCFGGEVGACVLEQGGGYGRCEDAEAAPICLYEPVDLPPPPPEPCFGGFQGGRSCAELGFTYRCNGGYSVRPGFPC